MLHDVCQFVGDSQVNVLWGCLCRHVEEGDFSLKMVSSLCLTVYVYLCMWYKISEGLKFESKSEVLFDRALL